MAQVYAFVDENGVTRLFAEIHPDPAGTPFNGGTITNGLDIDPATDEIALNVVGALNATSALLRTVFQNGGATEALVVWEKGYVSIGDKIATQPTLALFPLLAKNAGVSVFQISDSNGNPIFEVRDDDTVHIKTGTLVIADL